MRGIGERRLGPADGLAPGREERVCVVLGGDFNEPLDSAEECPLDLHGALAETVRVGRGVPADPLDEQAELGLFEEFVELEGCEFACCAVRGKGVQVMQESSLVAVGRESVSSFLMRERKSLASQAGREALPELLRTSEICTLKTRDACGYLSALYSEAFVVRNELERRRPTGLLARPLSCCFDC